MYRIGVDVGGTFTDLTLFDESSAQIFYHKVPSTPSDPSLAIEQGVAEILEREGVGAEEIVYFGHGTTVALNMLLERREPSIGFITTKGFRDVLEIARQTRPALYDYSISRPEPLARRAHRLEVTERLGADGGVLAPLSVDETEAAAAQLKAAGVKAIAICFLHAYRNADHERQAREIVNRIFPEALISLSSDVLPEFREFERASTTAVNAYVAPRMSVYLQRFVERIEKLGVTAVPFIVHSNGGVLPAPVAEKLPVLTCLSGPAAGVVGAAAVAKAAAAPDILAFDVGGTSTDVSLVLGGAPLFTSDRKVAAHPVKSPAIDVNAIGAGGGSIAWIDDAGVLKVGPKSAGADPGPVAYGRGGDQVTVTDANVVLGRLNPGGLAGGRMRMDVDAARRAIEDQFVGPLGASLEVCALGIIRVAAANIARAIRAVSASRGQSPKDFDLFAYGGAGPLLAVDVNDEVGCRRIIAPIEPGAMCARGILMSDLSFDFVATELYPATDSGWSKTKAVFDRLGDQAQAWLEHESIAAPQRRYRRIIEARYSGQSFEIPVEIDADASLDDFMAGFAAVHERQYGYDIPGRGVDIVNCRLTAIGEIPKAPQRKLVGDGAAQNPPAPIDHRAVYFGGEAGWTDAAIYHRGDLPSGAVLMGPAIIEEMSSTTVLPPDWRAQVDAYGNLFMEADAGDDQ
jgi:N-methylhydantoinase A